MAENVIYLARHGMHDWLSPAHNRLAGSLPGVRLNPQGIVQAQRLASRLATEPVAWIASSPLQRTLDTAEVIARPHGRGVMVDDRLREWKFGPWEGMAITDIQQRYPTEWALWRERPDQLRLAGAETIEQVATRMEEAYRAWAEHGGVGVLVSHQDPLSALLCRLLGAPLNEMRVLEIPPGSLSVAREVAYGTVVTGINLGALADD
jgi:broad specificity phosphatase PhoE